MTGRLYSEGSESRRNPKCIRPELVTRMIHILREQLDGCSRSERVPGECGVGEDPYEAELGEWAGCPPRVSARAEPSMRSRMVFVSGPVKSYQQVEVEQCSSQGSWSLNRSTNSAVTFWEPRRR